MVGKTFRVVLRDVKRHDSFETRELHLPIGSKVPIGRASKSVAKKELMAAPDNIYIDSPVMSRSHAILSVGGEADTPQFFITDSDSMHGTMLNGRSLAPDQPERLTPGDLLQFGVDINRNEAFFVARQYVFESDVPRRFSLGFAVPEAESDEEIVDATEQQGSQWNPLNIDDSDAGSNPDMATDRHDDDVTMEAAECAHIADTESAADGVDRDLTVVELEIPSMANDNNERGSLARVELASANSPGVYEFSSNRQVSDSDSDAGSDAESDDASSPAPYTSTDNVFETSSTQAEASSARSPMIKSRNAFTLEDNMDGYTGAYNEHTSTTSYATSSPTTRPSLLGATSFPGMEIHHFNSHDWPDLANAGVYIPHGGSYLNPDFAPGPSATHYIEYPMSTVPAASRHAREMQTPPLMPALDTVTSAPQPGRRTKVSIEEIVEHQPPSPESIKALKRKAEVLEEEHTPIVEGAATVPPASAEAIAHFGDAASALLAQRPKKQPTSVLAKVGRTAKYFGVGTAGALAALTALAVLPDTFFM